MPPACRGSRPAATQRLVAGVLEFVGDEWVVHFWIRVGRTGNQFDAHPADYDGPQHRVGGHIWLLPCRLPSDRLRVIRKLDSTIRIDELDAGP